MTQNPSRRRLGPDLRRSAAAKDALLWAFGVFGSLVAALAIGVIALNAMRERVRKCACLPDCWCKTRLGRHLRWWVPASHHLLPDLPYRGEPKPRAP